MYVFGFDGEVVVGLIGVLLVVVGGVEWGWLVLDLEELGWLVFGGDELRLVVEGWGELILIVFGWFVEGVLCLKIIFLMGVGLFIIIFWVRKNNFKILLFCICVF